MDRSTKAIGIIREFAKEKKYVVYGSHNDENGNAVVGEYEFHNTLPPRSFILTINSQLTMTTIQEVLKKYTKQHNAHVHGLYVMKKGWLIQQKAYTQPHHPNEFICDNESPLATFCTTILRSIQSLNIGAASLNRYLDDDRQT